MSKSLAAQAGALASPLELPAIFKDAPNQLVSRFFGPYITFAHSKRADEWNRIVGAYSNVAEGDMFLVETGEVTRLGTAKLSMLTCKQYWGQTNASGDVIVTSYEERPSPFKEHVEAVVLVYFDDSIVPANVQFRTTKTPAARALSSALIEAGTPEWGDKSSAHKETMVCAQPFMRFYGLVTLAPPRSAKGSGMPYRPTQCTIKPTSVQEWRLLKKFSDDEESMKLLNGAAERYTRRLQAVTEKLQK